MAEYIAYLFDQKKYIFHRYFVMEYIAYLFDKKDLFSVRSESVVGSISPSVSVGSTDLLGIVTVEAIVTSESTIVGSGLSLSLRFDLSFTFAQKMGSDSVVGSIG